MTEQTEQLTGHRIRNPELGPHKRDVSRYKYRRINGRRVYIRLPRRKHHKSGRRKGARRQYIRRDSMRARGITPPKLLIVVPCKFCGASIETDGRRRYCNRRCRKDEELRLRKLARVVARESKKRGGSS